MGMLLGSTVYMFSIILAVFLVGLAIGSGWARGSRGRCRDSARARLALGWCQLLLVLGIGWTAYHDRGFAAVLADRSVAELEQLVHVPARHGALPVGDSAADAAVGRELPAGAGGRRQAGRRSGAAGGRVYAANTLGAIIGALSVSLVLVPWIGTQQPRSCCSCFRRRARGSLLAPRVPRSIGGSSRWRRRSSLTATRRAEDQAASRPR